jgi:hypothetical protein
MSLEADLIQITNFKELYLVEILGYTWNGNTLPLVMPGSRAVCK